MQTRGADTRYLLQETGLLSALLARGVGCVSVFVCVREYLEVP